MPDYSEFEKAFMDARKQGIAQFAFNGQQYNTHIKNDPSPTYQLGLTDRIQKEYATDPSLKNVATYNTGLTKPEFNEFYNWAVKRYGSQDNVLYEMGNYDLQGAWKDIKSGKINFAENGHLPDTYKKPNHITFSEESRYHNAKDFGGRWEGADNNWQFFPSKKTVDLYGAEYLKMYFNDNEKDVRLRLDSPINGGGK